MSQRTHQKQSIANQMKRQSELDEKQRHYHGPTPKMLSGIKTPLQLPLLHT